jgi:DNA modification methylase
MDNIGGMGEYSEIDMERYPAFLSNLCHECYRMAAPDSWMILWFGPSHWWQIAKDSMERAGWTVCPIPGIWAKSSGQCFHPDIYMASSWEPFWYGCKGHPQMVK